MAHEDYTLWMSLALDAMLTPDEERQLYEHLQSCPDCHTTWKLWQRLDQQLRAAPMATPAPGLIIRVENRLRARALQRYGAAGGFLLITGAILLWSVLFLGILLALGWWLVHHPSLLIGCVSFAFRLASILFALLRGIQLAWASLLPPSMQSILIGFIVILMGLAVVWAQIVSRWRQPASRIKHR